MPKLRQSNADMAYKTLSAKVRYYQDVYDISTIELAAAARMHKDTLLRRLRTPEDITLGELNYISQKLHFAEEDYADIINLLLNGRMVKSNAKMEQRTSREA